MTYELNFSEPARLNPSEVPLVQGVSLCQDYHEFSVITDRLKQANSRGVYVDPSNFNTLNGVNDFVIETAHTFSKYSSPKNPLVFGVGSPKEILDDDWFVSIDAFHLERLVPASTTGKGFDEYAARLSEIKGVYGVRDAVHVGITHELFPSVARRTELGDVIEWVSQINHPLKLVHATKRGLAELFASQRRRTPKFTFETLEPRMLF